MNTGYLYTLLALGSFGTLGILSKLADVKKCRPSAVSALLYVWSAVMLSGVLVFYKHTGFGATPKVIVVAILFGVVAAASAIAFQAGLKYGKISTSWLVVNLSSSVPAIASILIYGESVTLRKASGLAVAVGALVLLYKDKDLEELGQSAHAAEQPSNERAVIGARANKLLWAQLMLVALLANGLGSFGLKILAENHLSAQYQYQYLLFWYVSAFIVASAVFLTRHSQPSKNEIVIGAWMGLCSVLGQVGMVMALSSKVPGYLVFPLAIGGNLFVVVAGGLILFKERLGSYGIVGLATGLAALVILAIP